jgi:uncharacterized membrane protein YczE
VRELSSVRNEKTLFVRYLMFVMGLAVGAFGCVLTIRANLGVAPWDTFHIGLQKTFGLTIGIWSQIVGAIVVILSYFLAGIKPGVPTVLNMICFGLFLDVYLWLDFVPELHTFVQRIVSFIVGFIIMCLGTGMYLSPRLGAGPRDSFMLALNERTGWSIQKVRICIEVSVLVVGALFGGPVSIGTVLIAVFTGPLIQRTIPFWEKRMSRQYGMVEQRHSKAVG